MTEEMKAIVKDLQGGRSVRDINEWQLALQTDWCERLKADMRKSEPRLSIPLLMLTVGTGLVALLIMLNA